MMRKKNLYISYVYIECEFLLTKTIVATVLSIVSHRLFFEYF